MAIVLVTGSRTWSDPRPVIAALNLVWHATVVERGETLKVMDGRCRTGVDNYVRVWGERCLFPDVLPLDRPARWGEHDPACSALAAPGSDRVCQTPRSRSCNRAGLRRNTEMVEEVAAMGEAWSLCLAFVRDGSSGATHCRGKAVAFGLDVVEFTWADWSTELQEFAKSAYRS